MTKMQEILFRIFKIGPIEVAIVWKTNNMPSKVIVEGNAFIFVNQGSSTITIDEQLIIPPSQSFSVPGQLFEMYNQTFNVNFSGGSGQLLTVIKIYR